MADGPNERGCDITVRLKDESSVAELQHGVYGCLFWLEPHDDGTYGILGAGIAQDSVGEAMLRVLLDHAHESDPGWEDRMPPVYKEPPTAEVADMMHRFRVHLGWDDDGTTAIQRCTR